jgi:hypothetical protein
VERDKPIPQSRGVAPGAGSTGTQRELQRGEEVLSGESHARGLLGMGWRPARSRKPGGGTGPCARAVGGSSLEPRESWFLGLTSASSLGRRHCSPTSHREESREPEGSFEAISQTVTDRRRPG